MWGWQKNALLERFFGGAWTRGPSGLYGVRIVIRRLGACGGDDELAVGVFLGVFRCGVMLPAAAAQFVQKNGQ